MNSETFKEISFKKQPRSGTTTGALPSPSRYRFGGQRTWTRFGHHVGFNGLQYFRITDTPRSHGRHPPTRICDDNRRIYHLH